MKRITKKQLAIELNRVQEEIKKRFPKEERIDMTSPISKVIFELEQINLHMGIKFLD